VGIRSRIAIDASLIEASDLARGQGIVVSARVLINQVSGLIGRGGDRLCDLGALCQAAGLVVAEDEELVFDDGAAGGRAEDVADQLAGNVGQVAVNFTLLVEPVVGDGQSGAVVFIGRAVKLVGS